VDPMSQLAFDLDDLSPEVEPAPAEPPVELPDRDRAAAVAKLASLIARLHAVTERTDDQS
jgi:hypothetical protein